LEIIQIAWKDIKILFKDVKALLFIILMPIVIICVLGISLNSIFEKDTANIQKCQIAILDKDDSDESKEFIDFFQAENVKKYIQIVDDTEEKAKKKIAEGKLSALIIIPEKYGESVSQNKSVNILLYADEGSPVDCSIVKSVLERYINPNNILISSKQAVQDSYDKYELDSKMVLEDIGKLLTDQEKLIEDGGFGSSKKTLSAMQYYSAAMVSMYILFVGMFGTASLLEEKENGTFRRLLSTGVSRKKMLSGKVLGNFVIGILDTSILILFTKFVYHVDWGRSIGGLILLTVTMAFAASGFAICVATIFQSAKTVDIVNPIIILIMAFIGGNMYPLYEMSEKLRKFSMILMNNWSLRGYLNLMINNGMDSILIPSLILTCMGGLFLAVGIVKLKVE
jgi:ABC-2 type transport system permease protein